MLTRIVQTSPKLCTFLNPLIERLSKPPRQHLRELCDAWLVCETEPTRAALQRLFVETTDPSNCADFLRIRPWNGEAARLEILQAQISWAIEPGQTSCQAQEISLQLDDSLPRTGSSPLAAGSRGHSSRPHAQHATAAARHPWGLLPRLHEARGRGRRHARSSVVAALSHRARQQSPA